MKYIPNSVTSKVSLLALKVSKHSPQILFGAGVAGVVGTVVLASKATLELNDILDEARENLELINGLDEDQHTPEEKVKYKAVLRIKGIASVGRLYLPAIVLGSVSIAALAGSHRILTTRNAALTAAYATLDKGFREYRARVVDDLGEERDKHYRYGVVKEKVAVVDEETGKKTVVEKKTATGISDYGKLFSESNANWSDRPEVNLIFLRAIEQMANDRLKSKGFLLLNDVYDELGIDRTTAGAVVGWLRNGDGNGFVDFGLFDDDMRIHDYITTRNGDLWIDFNVDGVIYDKIDRIF